MAPKYKTWIVGGISFFVGVALSGIVAVYFTSKYFMHGFYINELARTTVNIEVMRALNQGKIDKAIELLSTDIQASKELAKEVPDGTPEVTKKKIEQLKQLIENYESEIK